MFPHALEISIPAPSAAATGSEFGRVGILRLDDGAEFYANINPGE